MDIITRQQARAAGSKRFYTGKPCKFGHDSPRLVSTWQCLACAAVNSAKWRAKNPEKARKLDRRTRQRRDSRLDSPRL